MEILKLQEAIDHLEKADEILFHRMSDANNRRDDAFHDAVMKLRPMIRALQNELHYLEKDKLSFWKSLFGVSRAVQPDNKKGE